MVKQLSSYKALQFMVFTVKKHGTIIEPYSYSPLNMGLIKNISISTKKLNTRRTNNKNDWLMQYIKQSFSKFKTIVSKFEFKKIYLFIYGIKHSTWIILICKTQVRLLSLFIFLHSFLL